METLIFSTLSVIAITNIILGIIIFSRGIKSFPHVLFGLIAFTLAIWSTAIVGFYSQQFSDTCNWILLTHTAAILIPLFFLGFSVNFPQKLSNRKYIFTLASLIVSILILFIFSSDYIVGSTEGNSYQIGVWYPVYALSISGFFLIGFFFLLEQLKISVNDIQKKQIKYILIGSFIASTLAIIPDLILPYLNIFQFTWLGPIFTLIMIISLFLAMLRYQLFNIKIILTEVISILIVLALLLELFLAKSPVEILMKSIILIIVTIFSFLLIKGVYKEVKQREALAIANAGQENLIHIMNHQIKGYLGKNRSIFAELLTGDYGTLPEETMPLLKEGLDQSTKGVDYVQSILRGASAINGILPYDMRKTDLKSLISETIDNQKTIAKSKNLSFTSHIMDTDYIINGDPTQLNEAFRNLIENAIKYNVPNGKIFVSLTKDNQYVYFEVKDTGIGVSEDVKSRLFTPGGRSKDSTKYNPESSGFGLAFVKGVVEAHKGSVEYRPNSDDHGSTFIVKIPYRSTTLKKI